jgi:hypothetical protein
MLTQARSRRTACAERDRSSRRNRPGAPHSGWALTPGGRLDRSCAPHHPGDLPEVVGAKRTPLSRLRHDDEGRVSRVEHPGSRRPRRKEHPMTAAMPDAHPRSSEQDTSLLGEMVDHVGRGGRRSGGVCADHPVRRRMSRRGGRRPAGALHPTGPRLRRHLRSERPGRRPTDFDRSSGRPCTPAGVRRRLCAVRERVRCARGPHGALRHLPGRLPSLRAALPRLLDAT